MQIEDQTGRRVHLNNKPKRIISLVPSQTELLVDLGLKENIIGITKFCVHPKGLRKEKEIIGGTKEVDLEKIKALKPDLILGNKEENTRKMVEQLTVIAPVHLSNIASVQDTLDLIEDYGQIFNVKRAADKLIQSIQENRLEFKQKYTEGKSKKLKVAYFIWRKPWMVAASKTFIHTMIKEQGWENVFGDLERYPLVKLSDMPTCDLVLLPSEPYPFKEEHRQEILDYCSPQKILFIDGEYFSWYGSRMSSAYTYFESLHQKLN